MGLGSASTPPVGKIEEIFTKIRWLKRLGFWVQNFGAKKAHDLRRCGYADTPEHHRSVQSTALPVCGVTRNLHLADTPK
jgi:hypothetical protein